MNELLNSIKADLLDRRLLPLLALVGAALVAALAYVVLSGSSATPPSAGRSKVSIPTGISVSQAPVNPNQPVAETTSGTTGQRRGNAHNPFNPLPGAAKAASTSTTASTGTSSSSTTSGASTKSGASAPSTGGAAPTAPTTPSKPVVPPKRATIYHVAALFGVVPAGTPPQSAQLTEHKSLKLLAQLPSDKQPLIVFRGVTVGGKSATFTLVSDAIIRGSAICLPSASQCQEIVLKPGQSEQLEYLLPTGQPVTYELRILGIASGKATSAAVERLRKSTSKAGRATLRNAGLLAIPGLRFTSSLGVLAYVSRPASAAPAHGH
jgi:hypothetical protein